MKSFFLFIFLWINPLTFIAEMNELKVLVENDFQRGDFIAVQIKLEKLLNEYSIEVPEIYLNLGHAYFNRRMADKAKFYYEKALEKSNSDIQSIAYNQLGFLANVQQNNEEALTLFREALLKNPQNNEARFNFELIQKQLMMQREKNQKEKQNSSTQNKKNKSNKDKSILKSSEIQLNQEKAEALLNAIKKQETQYLQQVPKGITLPPPPQGKPDW
jgi:tetratricopeptide (TPR) repeat protein